jgi:hypothetical protein
MNTERILTAGMTVVVIAAVGLSASTLASSMSTDPSDAVDVEWDALPLGDDSQADIQSAAENVDEQYRQSGASGAGASQGGGDTQQQSRSGGGSAQGRQADEASGDRESRSGSVGDGGARADSADQQGPEQAGQSRSDSGSDLGPTGWPRALLVALALLLVAVVLAYRYRERLRRMLRGHDDPVAEPLAPAPENDVERAWVELVRRAGIDRPRTRTPRDCARRAVETGFDPDRVERLRRTFEDVRYGTHPPTDEQARVARETLARLNGERV